VPQPDPHQPLSDWLVPGALVGLSLVPVIAGVARVSHLIGGAPISANDARFALSPVPVVAHILVVSLYCLLGAFQFAPGFRSRYPRWHRAAGRILVPSGLAAAFTGLWMTQVYSRIATDSDLLHGLRLLVGAALVASILMALYAIRKRDFPAHGAWMVRAYALGQGAGTQVFTHLPWFLLVGVPGPTSRAMLMGAGWLINVAVAEVLIFRRDLAVTRRQAGFRAWSVHAIIWWQQGVKHLAAWPTHKPRERIRVAIDAPDQRPCGGAKAWIP
jgi:hypothetical protein